MRIESFVSAQPYANANATAYAPAARFAATTDQFQSSVPATQTQFGILKKIRDNKRSWALGLSMLPFIWGCGKNDKGADEQLIQLHGVELSPEEQKAITSKLKLGAQDCGNLSVDQYTKIMEPALVMEFKDGELAAKEARLAQELKAIGEERQGLQNRIEQRRDKVNKECEERANEEIEKAVTSNND